MSKVHVREDGKFLKIAVYPIPLTEDTVKDLVRQIAKGKGNTLNNVTMLWHADGSHALELIFERSLPPTPSREITALTPKLTPATPPEQEIQVKEETEAKTPRKKRTSKKTDEIRV